MDTSVGLRSLWLCGVKMQREPFGVGVVLWHQLRRPRLPCGNVLESTSSAQR
jgi:hypothetical protein